MWEAGSGSGSRWSSGEGCRWAFLKGTTVDWQSLATKDETEICLFCFPGYQWGRLSESCIAAPCPLHSPEVLRVIGAKMDDASGCKFIVDGLNKFGRNNAPVVMTTLGPGIREIQVENIDDLIRDQVTKSGADIGTDEPDVGNAFLGCSSINFPKS